MSDKTYVSRKENLASNGGVAQMVERSLSMREVRGSMPRTSIVYYSGVLGYYLNELSAPKPGLPFGAG